MIFSGLDIFNRARWQCNSDQNGLVCPLEQPPCPLTARSRHFPERVQHRAKNGLKYASF
jgi:hypothetical protein